MMRAQTCPKCTVRDVLRIPGDLPRNKIPNAIGGGLLASGVAVTRYLCASCGYSEEWVESPEDREKLRKKYREQ